MVLDSAKRMGDLIDDLLAFSRIGRADTQKSLVSLSQLVKERVSDLRQEVAVRAAHEMALGAAAHPTDVTSTAMRYHASQMTRAIQWAKEDDLTEEPDAACKIKSTYS